MDQLLRALSGARTHNSTRFDEGRNAEFLSRRKMKAHTVVGRGEEGPLCDPGSELLLGGSAEKCEHSKWEEEKNVME